MSASSQLLLQILEEVRHLRSEIADVRERVARLEESVNELKRRNKSITRFAVTVYVITLSFLASVLGINWVLPR